MKGIAVAAEAGRMVRAVLSDSSMIKLAICEGKRSFSLFCDVLLPVLPKCKTSVTTRLQVIADLVNVG